MKSWKIKERFNTDRKNLSLNKKLYRWWNSQTFLIEDSRVIRLKPLAAIYQSKTAFNNTNIAFNDKIIAFTIIKNAFKNEKIAFNIKRLHSMTLHKKRQNYKLKSSK